MKGVEIAGGGVCGLALGNGLRLRGVPVTLYEAGHYPRHRLCGEFVNGVRPETLSFLGLDDLMKDAVVHRKMSWSRGDDCFVSGELDFPGRGLSRFQMDDRLQRAFTSRGGDLRTGTRMEKLRQEGMVWTAGRMRAKESHWIGLKAHFKDIDGVEGLEMHLGKNAYVGVAEVEDGWVNVCGLFELQPTCGGKGAERMFSYLEHLGLAALSQRLRGASVNEKSFCGVSGVQFGQQEKPSGLLCVGDAAWMIPPFTGNGMSMAFEAAEVAVEPLIRYAEGEMSWGECYREVESALEQRFRARVTLANGLHWGVTQVWGQEMAKVLAKWNCLPLGFLSRALTQ